MEAIFIGIVIVTITFGLLLYRRYFYAFFLTLIFVCFFSTFFAPSFFETTLPSGPIKEFILASVPYVAGFGVFLMFPLLVIIVNFFLEKKFTQAFLIMILIPIVVLMNAEKKFVYFPLADTVHSKRFTVERFESIKPGMTKEQVEALIGIPPAKVGEYFVDETGCIAQTTDGAAILFDFAWFDTDVCYDEHGRVNETQSRYVSN